MIAFVTHPQRERKHESEGRPRARIQTPRDQYLRQAPRCSYKAGPSTIDCSCDAVSTSTAAPIMQKNMTKLKFLDIDATESARQLTIIGARLYGKIKPTGLGSCA